MARADGRCERCGCVHESVYDIHHRQPRGMGGSTRNPNIHAPSSLLVLCGGYQWSCHRYVEEFRVEAEAGGFLVPRPAIPRDVPVRYHGVRWVLLDDDGGVVDTPTPIV